MGRYNKNKVFSKIKAFFSKRLVQFVIATLVGLGGILFAQKSETISNNSQNNAGNIFQPSVLGDNTSQTNNYNINLSTTEAICDYEVCEDFSDLNKWILHPNLQVLDKFPLRLKAYVDNKQRGGYMFLKNEYFKPSFTSSLVATPCGSTEADIVFLYGNSYQYIIGDGGYSRIKVKVDGQYVSPKGYDIGYYPLAKPIKPCTQLQLKIDTTIKDEKSLVVNSTLNYTDLSGYEREQKIPPFIVYTIQKTWSIRNLVGVGLQDWNNLGDISAVLVSLNIEPTL